MNQRGGFSAPAVARAGTCRRRRPALVALLLAAAGIAGCVSYSDIGPTQTPKPVSALAADRAVGVADGHWPTQQWWRRFGDPQLDQLIDEALAGNPELDGAVARLRGARAAAEVANAARSPGYSGSFSSEYQRFTENGVIPPPFGGSKDTFNDLSLKLDYHLDFWGRNRAAFQAALSRQRVAAAERAETSLVLATAIASTYIELARQYALLDVAEQTLKQRQSIYDLTDKRVRAGLDTRVQLKQAESELPAIRGDIAAIHESINATRYALAALLGAGPDRGLAIRRPALDPAAVMKLAVPATLPAGLLGRRPDIVAARWRVEAAGSDVKVAKAEFYPNVNLSAFVGFSSIGLDNLLERGSRVYGGGPAITLPIFARHTLRGNLSERYAAYDAAVAAYDRALVDALKQVAVDVNAGHWLVERRREQRAALKTAREALVLATDRYRAGLGNYLTVLQAQTAVLARQREGAALDARALLLRINLIRALGGGFDDSATSSPTAGATARSAGQATGAGHDDARS